jgi:peptidoglycan hydrolase CwlO-like protein
MSDPKTTPVHGGIVRGILVALVAVLCLSAVPVAAAVTLETERQKARALAGEVAELDARIDTAAGRYARATNALAAVRASIRANREALHDAQRQVSLARGLLADRARSMYKQATPTTVDVLLGVADFGDLVSQLELLQRLGAGDADYVRALRRGERALRERSLALTADEATAERLASECAAELEGIRSRLDDRRRLLAGAESRVRELVAESSVTPARAPTAKPAEAAGTAGEGEWWPSIKRAAAANDVSADGLYRLMLVESGGSATIVGPGGYHGLYQYSLVTWRGSWNPYRSASIYDGEAQIKATALAVARGYGASFWPSTYGWAFGE